MKLYFELLPSVCHSGSVGVIVTAIQFSSYQSILQQKSRNWAVIVAVVIALVNKHLDFLICSFK